ncbi:MAG: DegT/DnrJ/EryC1/StrS family aminotransferase [Saprospiraceae bacterium]|nr:DegT/DnrJ/EryC1/StrS family aminotransferase [Saprospiraceae bacterium]MBK8547834.1 DegT/DnrJ/EryC1/StrS family aminotransferase [Saprospiraceae bacterium]MBK8853013.1 DegT/DnrJ/EryC1/StrS family aminotransferase [Saprospiraceae bacterium]MBP6693523.1 DegT/DnrJ/EryC1/StrS family aminotransferase [Saprospiraceae bacterium]
MLLQMVDVKSQYVKIKEEVDRGIHEVLDTTIFIGGPKVKKFQEELEVYLGVKHVIPCANGTDAIQIALMGLGLRPGDEVIVPAFTYVATAEVIALLGLIPVMVDVDADSFNVSVEGIKKAITPRTKAIVPVHLYGQSAEMEAIMNIAQKHNIFVVEDNAQAIGADYLFSNGGKKKSGTIGHIGCTSFYPSKNLGCYGDGGAIMTNDDNLAFLLQKIANHGQSVRYYHDVVGVNSRLDAIQAVVLSAKLKHLDEYNLARQKVADYYDAAFAGHAEILTPLRSSFSTHVFHQYTLRIKNGKRDSLKDFLDDIKIPNMIYYPVPLYKQEAFKATSNGMEYLENTELLCKEVISLPIHTEMDPTQLDYIINVVKTFFK